jgi:hypothetical protein
MAIFFAKIVIITLVFEKNAIFFAENCQKSQKIVIITSVPVIAADLQEVLLVPLPDAVVDPGAVVVHAQDAAAADPAVVRARRPVHLAPGTHFTKLL